MKVRLFGHYIVYLFLSGDAQNERARTTMIKAQVEEELKKLEDEIADCKWTQT